MVSSLPLLSCELSVSVKENPDRKKKKKKDHKQFIAIIENEYYKMYTSPRKAKFVFYVLNLSLTSKEIAFENNEV